MNLSAQARAILNQAGIRRDPRKSGSECDLRAKLQQLGLPVPERALRFEREFGGLVWRDTVFSVLAALEGRSAEYPPPGKTLPPRAPDTYREELVVPISVDQEGHSEFSMTALGEIVRDVRINREVVASAPEPFFERQALKLNVEALPSVLLRWRCLPSGTEDDFSHFGESSALDDDDGEDAEPLEYASDPQRAQDERLADALALPVFGPASDRRMQVWFDGDRLLFPYYPWQPDERLLRARTVEDIARVVQAARAVRPSVAAIWRGALGDAPRSDEEVVATAAAIDDNGRWLGHYLWIGTAGCHVHLRRFEQPRYIARLWEDRHDEWKRLSSRA